MTNHAHGADVPPDPFDLSAADPRGELRALGVRLAVLGPRDAAEAAAALSDVFSEREPLARALALTRAAVVPFAGPVCEAAAAAGLSVIARDREERLFGFCIAEPWPPQPAASGEPLPGFAPIFALLGRLEEEFDRLHAVDRRAVHVQMIGCAAGYERHGLATATIRAALALAARRGVPRAFAEATHDGSARVFERLGWRTLAEIPYATFELEGRRVFAGVPSRACRLVVKDLLPPHPGRPEAPAG